MAFESLGNKQLKERMDYLTNKLESLYEKVEPLMADYYSIKKELEDILDELKRRENE